jgi:hypothetical protein
VEILCLKFDVQKSKSYCVGVTLNLVCIGKQTFVSRSLKKILSINVAVKFSQDLES